MMKDPLIAGESCDKICILDGLGISMALNGSQETLLLLSSVKMTGLLLEYTCELFFG